MTQDTDRFRQLLRLGVVLSLLLLVLRATLALSTWFGDSEALYACYALFPQPAYLDHPGLVGLIARTLGGGDVPLPARTHLLTAFCGGLVPWLGALVARQAGASPAESLFTALVLILVPELAIGLYGFTPDLILCLAWLGALAAALAAHRLDPGSFWRLIAVLGCGILVGLATLGKVTGALLGLTLLVWLLTMNDRRQRTTLAPWLGCLVALLLVSPVISWEVRQGYPMLEHRLVTTQANAGFSLRNLGALVGGQLLYVSPLFVWAGALVLRDLYRRRREDDATWLLWLATVIPGIPLVLLCLWSKVAEPHWLAPALLPLAVHAARSRAVSPRLARFTLASGAILIALVWATVKTPLLQYLPQGLLQPRYDLTNDLYVWGPGRKLLDAALDDAITESHELPVIVGPHWTVCAQAQAALGRRARVGCNGPKRDDFDRWLPRSEWLRARVILYVHDDRFAVDPTRELGPRKVTALSKVGIRRGGRVVRTLHVTRLEKESEVGLGR